MQHTNNPGKGVRIRPIVTTLIVGIVIPITLFFGTAHMTERKYYIISLLVIIYAMLPFFIAFEKAPPKGAELVIIAVLSALAIASRTAFFMVPQFKPMGAIVINLPGSASERRGLSCGGDQRLYLQYAFRAGTVDAVADVRLWHHVASCRPVV